MPIPIDVRLVAERQCIQIAVDNTAQYRALSRRDSAYRRGIVYLELLYTTEHLASASDIVIHLCESPLFCSKGPILGPKRGRECSKYALLGSKYPLYRPKSLRKALNERPRILNDRPQALNDRSHHLNVRHHPLNVSLTL